MFYVIKRLLFREMKKKFKKQTTTADLKSHVHIPVCYIFHLKVVAFHVNIG